MININNNKKKIKKNLGLLINVSIHKFINVNRYNFHNKINKNKD